MALLNSCKLIAFVAARDASLAKAFYAGKLGIPLLSEDNFALVFDAFGTILRVTLVREVALAPYTVLGWEISDIEVAARELSAQGVELLRFPGMDQDDLGVWTAPGGAARVAWFKDPDGNVLSISQHSA
jgi:catechol 2,3-dioxygenase-like lactoylglutathione lyase family enzyme